MIIRATETSNFKANIDKSLAGIYIHIPFCKQACHYCDFHFSTTLTLREELLGSIAKELKLQKNYLTDSIETVYFGGGTPSLLTGSEIKEILTVISENFELSTDPEITLEANPDDLTEKKLLGLHAAGVNRLSIGVQSFDSDVLKFLNRAHSEEQAEKCISIAQEIGFTDLTIDLIYGIPGRNHQLWEQDIEKLLSFNPDHISAYCLTIEPDTAFGNWRKKGKLTPVTEDFAAEQFEILAAKLSSAQYDQYEISNFCKNNKYSRHNTAYWQDKTYLGIGPSAHSYNRVSRQYNVKNNAQYIKAINKEVIPFQLENLSPTDQLNDYLITGIRTKWGINLSKFHSNFSLDGSYIDMLVKNGKAKVKDGYLILTTDGRLIADQITEDLFLDADSIRT